MAGFSPFVKHGFPPDKWRHKTVEPETSPRRRRVFRDPFSFLCLPFVLAKTLATIQTTAGRAWEIHLRQLQDLQLTAQRTFGMEPFPCAVLIKFADPALEHFHRRANENSFRIIL